VLGSSLLSLGLLAGALALAVWWVHRTAFDTNHTSEVAQAALQNASLRGDLASTIADQVSLTLGLNHAQVQAAADAALEQPGVAPSFAGVLREVHSRLIGETSGPVAVPADLVTRAVSSPSGVKIPSVNLDIATIEPLDTTRLALERALPILIALGIGFSVAGLILHPSKPTALRTIGAWLLGASLVELLFAYAVPTLLLPAVVDSPYADLVAEVDKATIQPLIGVLVMMAGAGLACLIAGTWLDRPSVDEPPSWATTRW
jgi:hypothetical protein